MMKSIFSFVLFILISQTTHSQSIDTSVLSTYPSSVVIKVHEVGSKIMLTNNEQFMLAELFLEEEQTIGNAILVGSSTAIIDSLKKLFKNDFNLLLPASKIDNYYNAIALPKANTIATLTAAMLQQKYNTDTLTQQYFNTIYGWRENLIEKVWAKSTDTLIRNNILQNIITVYDSVISRYTLSAASSHYLAIRLYYIDSVLSIPANQKNALVESYFMNCMQYKNRAYSDNFNTAFNTVFTQPQDTVYYAAAYNNEITRNSIEAAQVSLSVYIKTYSLSAMAATQITPYLVQRERAIALSNKLYANYSEAKDSLINNILLIHQPVIDSVVSLYAHLYNNSQIDIAIKFAAEIDLDENQLNTLHQAVATLKEMETTFRETDPFGEFDSKAYESEVLNSVLTPEQYTYVLEAKYYSKASAMANKDWTELVRLNIAGELSLQEAITKTELTNYHVAIFIAYYRNANNPEEQYISIQRINEVMPETMRLLLDRWAESGTPYGNLPDVFFQW